MAEKFKIQFPVGDWSDDGHGKCEYYFAWSNKPVQDLREAHFKAKEVLGFDIGSICEDYEQYSVNGNIIDELLERGLMDEDEAETAADFYDSDSLVKLWVRCLIHIDPTLEIELFEPENDYQTINFYGYDDKQRHLSTPGYGLFD